MEYTNQKEIDALNEKLKKIDENLKLGRFGVNESNKATMQKSLEQNISKLNGTPERVRLILCGREEFGRKNSCIRYAVLER